MSRVSAVQFKARRGDVPSSREALCELVDQAAAGADLVVFPEMAVSGYVFESREQVGEIAERPEGPTFQRLSALAARHGAWIVGGFAERAGEELYNSAWVIDDQGALRGVYRKTLLYEADEAWACPGNSGYLCVETPLGRLGVGICMDLNDDRFVAWLQEAEVELLAFPTNWVDEGDPVWDYWAWRLRDTRVTLVAANTWGQEGAVGFTGRSAVLSGRRVLGWAPAAGDGLVCVALG